MISLLPIYTHIPHVKRSRLHVFPQKTKQLFYLSWEDALWDILDHKHIPLQSVILVPEFFCGDVENNIKTHGYRVEHYPVDAQLQTTKEELIRCIKKYNPSVLVVLDAVGIRNSLWNSLGWMKELREETLLIEDCVHRIIESKNVVFLKHNHILIDSLRKVLPLQGSVVYGRTQDLQFTEPPRVQSLGYAIAVLILWFVMMVLLTCAHKLYKTPCARVFALFAEFMMKWGYAVIGNSMKPSRGFYVFISMLHHIDLLKIKKIKEKQVNVYESQFPQVRRIYEDSDKGELRGWPVIINKEHAQEFLQSIRSKGLLLRFELNDSVWSTARKIVYLPLGAHMTKSQQMDVCSIVRKAILQFPSVLQ